MMLAIIAGLAVALASATACAREPTALARAHDVLLVALKERQPAVDRFELMPLGSGQAKWLRMEGATAEFEVRNESSSARRARVVIRYDHLDGSRREESIWWSVRAMSQALVARRAIRANDRVTANDFVVETVDVAGMEGLLKAFEPGGPARQARRFIAAGKPVREMDLETPPDVDRDQMVKVRVGAGPVLIETTGIAIEQGHLGDIIRISNPASRMRYSARISAAGEVTVGSWPE